MIVTRKHLARRTFLRGFGATVALPWLDAMVPAATAASRVTAMPAKRLSYVFIPMGCDLSRWTPSGKDTLEELSPILQSLAPVKQHVNVISNLELLLARTRPSQPRDRIALPAVTPERSVALHPH